MAVAVTLAMEVSAAAPGVRQARAAGCLIPKPEVSGHSKAIEP